MGKEEYNNLISMLTFLKLQNDCILQLLVNDTKTYNKINKEIIKAWEETINENKTGN